LDHFHKQTNLFSFLSSRRVFCAEELALRFSEGTYAFECAAKSFLAAIISIIKSLSCSGIFVAFQKGVSEKALPVLEVSLRAEGAFNRAVCVENTSGFSCNTVI
jgi:hypothetical protein